MLAAPTLLPLAGSPAIGPKRSTIGRRSEGALPLGLVRPHEPQQLVRPHVPQQQQQPQQQPQQQQQQQQGNVVYQARPFLAHVHKDLQQKQLSARRLGSPPKEPLQRQTSARRVGSPPKEPLQRQTSARRVSSPPKEVLQRQTSTRRVGSPPPPTKTGSPSPAQSKRGNAAAQDESKTSNSDKATAVQKPRLGHPGHPSPRVPVLGATARPGQASPRAPGTTTSQSRGAASPVLYVPKGLSVEVAPMVEQVYVPKGLSVEAAPKGLSVEAAPMVEQVYVPKGLSVEAAPKGLSVEAAPMVEQIYVPKGLSIEAAPMVEQVQSDTASTASQENAQNDTASNSSQDIGASPEQDSFDPGQAALVWTPRVAAGSECISCDTSRAAPGSSSQVGASIENNNSSSCVGASPEQVNFEATEAAVLWTPRVRRTGSLQTPAEHIGVCRAGSFQPQLSHTNKGTDTSDPNPDVVASLENVAVGSANASSHPSPTVGAISEQCVNADATVGDAADPIASAGVDAEIATVDNTTAAAAEATSELNAAVSEIRHLRAEVGAALTPADSAVPTMSSTQELGPMAEACSEQAALSHEQPEGKGGSVALAASTSKDQKQGDVNNASGAASPRAPRCLTRIPQQRVLRSRSPPSSMDRGPEKNGRSLDQMPFKYKMSPGSLEAFAAECQNVCKTYENNLHELQLLCSAIDRTAQSPRGGASRQSNCGTPDSSCRPSCRGTVRTLRTSGSKSSTPDQSWRALHESKKASTPERNWRMTAGRKDAGTPERNWRSAVRKDASTPERSVRAPCLTQGSDLSRGPRGTDAASQERTPRPSLIISKTSTPSMTTKAPCRQQGLTSISRTDSTAVDIGRPVKDESVVQSLLSKGFLTLRSAGWINDPVGVPDDLAHVRTLFSAQVPGASILSVYRVKHDAHTLLCKAVQETMESKTECILWHGTSMDCVRNIALNGFNRNYCGRHGMKLGYGTYFSSSADYSVRFCDRRATKRVMFLAKVLVGMWTKGSHEMKEPPFRDNEGMVRYDSTVDSVESPNIFCVFRDYQAVPLYLIEFNGPS